MWVIRFVYVAGMRISFCHLDSETLDRLADTLRSSNITRHALARVVLTRQAVVPLGPGLPAVRDVPDTAAAPADRRRLESLWQNREGQRT